MTNAPRHPINKYAPPTPLPPPPPPPKRGDEAKWASYDKRYNDILSRLNSLSSDLESFKSGGYIPTEVVDKTISPKRDRAILFSLSTSELYELSCFASNEYHCNKEFEISVNVTIHRKILSIRCNDCGRSKIITQCDNT